MVFGFFSRKSSLVTPTTTTTTVEQTQSVSHEHDAHVAGSTSVETPFVFPKDQKQLHTPAPSISFSTPPITSTGSPPPMPPPHTPSPAPEPEVTDPKALHTLITSVPAQTLHEYCLTLLDPASFDTVTGRAALTKKRRRKSTVAAEDASEAANAGHPLKPHPLLTPPTLGVLTAFFRELLPPPQLHCVRCHKQYFELENTDYSCRVAHDDDSTIVERIGTKVADSTDDDEDSEEDRGSRERDQSPRRPRKSGVIQQKSSIYETLWGCCGQTVEGDGDQGPPDGWCYEGRHTTDLKRARFRADSTPQEDKLVSCAKLKCFRPPVSQASATTGTPSVCSTAVRKRKRTAKSSIDYREVEDDEAQAKGDEWDDDAKSTTSSVKRRRKDSSATPGRGKGKGRGGGVGRKRVFKSKEEVDEQDDKDDGDAMQVDEVPQAGPSTAAAVATPQSPPASPRRKPVSTASTSSTSAVTAPAVKPKRPRGRPPNTKPVNPSPLGVQREDTLPAVENASATPRGRSKSQVFVELPSRHGSRSPNRGGVLTRADILSLKAKGSVASLRDKFENGNNSGDKEGEEKKSLRTRKKPLELAEVVGSSVDNEIEMS